VRELARLVELERMLDRFPHELSGGQQQRVALARALAPEPDILLLDEPLSALDARIRARLRDELRAIVDRLGVTALYVTHDQEEALALSDRVAVMRQGRIEQVGSPAEIYHRPGSRFVAEFVGVANIVDGRAVPGGVEADGVVWPAPGLDGASGAASVVYRPEHLALAAPGADGLSGRVEAATFLGPVVRLRVALAQGRTVVVDRASTELPESWRPGAGVVVQPRRERATVLPAAR
jgi:ABC-type Fe3+/spermidine/putrescine transport system ATPase subunit